MRQVTSLDVEAVERMLLAGMRQVEIARELDLSVWTVTKIARALRREEQVLQDGESMEDDGPPGFEARNLRRCPECGAMVYLWPCLACRMSTNTLPLDLAIEEEEPEEQDEFFVGDVA